MGQWRLRKQSFKERSGGWVRTFDKCPSLDPPTCLKRVICGYRCWGSSAKGSGHVCQLWLYFKAMPIDCPLLASPLWSSHPTSIPLPQDSQMPGEHSLEVLLLFLPCWPLARISHSPGQETGLVPKGCLELCVRGLDIGWQLTALYTTQGISDWGI